MLIVFSACLFLALRIWSCGLWHDDWGARWFAWFCYLLVDYGGNASHMQKQQVESSGPVQLSKFLGRDKDDGVRRSAVSGKKILLKLDKTKEDKEAESKRNELLKFLNASYDWLLKPDSWCKFPARSGKCWSNISSKYQCSHCILNLDHFAFLGDEHWLNPASSFSSIPCFCNSAVTSVGYLWKHHGI